MEFRRSARQSRGPDPHSVGRGRVRRAQSRRVGIHGRELFGNNTPVGWGFEGRLAANGFEALAFFDMPQNGGNADGVIDSGDAIYPQLRLWFDTDSDGVSSADELVSLADAGVRSISLSTVESHKQDRFGNDYRFRSQVSLQWTDNATVRRFAYDVFLMAR